MKNLTSLLLLGVSLLFSQEAKTTDYKPLDASDSQRFEDLNNQIALLQTQVNLAMAQKEILRLTICDKHSLHADCLVGKTDNGQWVAVAPQSPPPSATPSKTVPAKPATDTGKK
jgi:hypothetical protein